MLNKLLSLLLLSPLVNGKKTNVNTLSYSLFPTRLNPSAAVIEWGNSAKIAAIDAVVATFGTQTSFGAYFEVEAKVSRVFVCLWFAFF